MRSYKLDELRSYIDELSLVRKELIDKESYILIETMKEELELFVTKSLLIFIKSPPLL